MTSTHALQPGKIGGLDRLVQSDPYKGDPVGAFQATLADSQAYGDIELMIHKAVFAAHGASYVAGWWHDPDTGEVMDQPYNVPVKMALIHSEVSEALEGDRKHVMDDKLPHRPMIEVELADAAIRLFDLAGALGLDLGGAFVEKMQYNARRADHRIETRRSAGGKGY